jgi:hypothetical protein
MGQASQPAAHDPVRVGGASGQGPGRSTRAVAVSGRGRPAATGHVLATERLVLRLAGTTEGRPRGLCSSWQRRPGAAGWPRS